METLKMTYTAMDWSKLKHLTKQLGELDINYMHWHGDQVTILEVDVTSEDALIVLQHLKIINQDIYDELFGQVQILFLH